MGFFDILGAADNLVGLYGFIRDKLTTDQKQFERKIKEIVHTIYTGILKDLNANSKEYQNALPPGGDKPLAERVILCLWENRAFTQTDVLPEDDTIPALIRKGLFEVLLKALHSSLEYTQREYMDWSKQKIEEIYDTIQLLVSDLILDSAWANHNPRKSGSRFHYSKKWTNLYGRDDDLDRLKEFCTEKKPFSWWVITGEGGSGKTRLAYALADQMEAQGWTICAPTDHTKETLDKCSESLRRNTLFLLDYSEYDTSTIGKWMHSFGENKYSRLCIRVLLVQRVQMRLDDFWSAGRTDMESFLKATAYCNGESLSLQPIKVKEDFYQLIESFSSHRKAISRNDAKIIYEHLTRVDGQFLRPLFAMILTDAYLDNPNEVRQWDREDILDYIYEKEIGEIQNSILHCCGESLKTREGKTLYRVGLRVQMMATMTGGFTVERDKSLLEEDFWKLEQLEVYDEFLHVPALFGGETTDMHLCPPLEPDIIGEYFVLKQWEEWGGAEHIKKAWTKRQYMSRFVGRLFQDFSDRLVKWKSYLLNITIPDSMTSIGRGTFEGCESLMNIIIPDSVIYIGWEAFERCKSLTNIDIPELVNYIGWGAFNECQSLASITIPDLVTHIGEYAFARCRSLTNIKIPDSVTFIGEYAFYDCASLTNIIIPDSVTSIGERAFSHCDSLQFISIPDTLQYDESCFPPHTKINIRKPIQEPLTV